jgi:quercetin dioxygenase-like cupin family protein
MKSFPRLYSDHKGESHFEQVEIDLELTDYAPPAPPLSLSANTPATQFGFMNAPAGWSSDWHPSSARNIFVVLSGEWEVTASDGESRRFGVGSVLLVEDTTGKGHSSRVVSAVDSLAVMVELLSHR